METDGLRWALLVIGSLVIVGLAIHGIWISRKNSEKKAGQRQPKSELELHSSEYRDPSIDDDIPLVDDFNQADYGISTDLADAPFSANSEQVTPSIDNFDDLGLGAVRVVSASPTDEKQQGTESQDVAASQYTEDSGVNKHNADDNLESIQGANSQPPEKESLPTNEVPENVKPASKIYASVVTQPKPEYAAKYQSLAAETVAISQQERAGSGTTAKSAVEFPSANNATYTGSDGYQAPEPPPFLLKKEPESEVKLSHEPSAVVSHLADTKTSSKASVEKAAPAPESKSEEKPHTTLAEKLSLTEQARNLVKRKKADSGKKRREPKIAEDQMRIDFDDQPKAEIQPNQNPEQNDSQAQTSPETEQQQEVLVLNVKVADGEPIPGAALLPMLLTLGFKFGDQDIFHRHVNSNGKGPVLFSLANMFKPGNFDIDNLENFTTGGISLFMILPIEGEPHQVFNMMHNAARKIADEFSGQIYDGRRALLTKQSLQQYVEKIREFERQRLLKR